MARQLGQQALSFSHTGATTTQQLQYRQQQYVAPQQLPMVPVRLEFAKPRHYDGGGLGGGGPPQLAVILPTTRLAAEAVVSVCQEVTRRYYGNTGE